MRKFKSFIILISSIVIVLSLWGCQRSGLSGQDSSPGAVSSMFRDALKTAADYKDSRLSSPNPSEGGDSDRFETLSGKDCPAFLQETEKSSEAVLSFIKVRKVCGFHILFLAF